MVVRLAVAHDLLTSCIMDRGPVDDEDGIGQSLTKLLYRLVDQRKSPGNQQEVFAGKCDHLHEQ